MKEFHPSATAIDSRGVRTHYLLHYGDVQTVKKGGTQPAVVVNDAQFREYVKAGRIQLFQDLGEGPVVRYTEEEAKQIKKATKKLYHEYDTETYWRNEMTFRNEAIELEHGVSFALVMARRTPVGKLMYMVSGCIYAPGITQDMRDWIKKNSLNCTFLATDLCMCNWELNQFCAVVRSCSDVPTTVCTKIMEDLSNRLYTHKMIGFKPIDANDLRIIMETINMVKPPIPVQAKRAGDASHRGPGDDDGGNGGVVVRITLS